MVVKSIMVRPDGFEVSSEAVKMHGITQEKLEIAGVPLDDALQVMVTDVLQQCFRGARLVESGTSGLHQTRPVVFILRGWVLIGSLL